MKVSKKYMIQNMTPKVFRTEEDDSDFVNDENGNPLEFRLKKKAKEHVATLSPGYYEIKPVLVVTA